MVTWGSKTTAEKRDIEDRCDVQWPCKGGACPNGGQRNYDWDCPEHWNLGDDKQCEAPLAYEGPCAKSNVKLPAGQSVEVKMKFAKDCEAPFPCYPPPPKPPPPPEPTWTPLEPRQFYRAGNQPLVSIAVYLTRTRGIRGR